MHGDAHKPFAAESRVCGVILAGGQSRRMGGVNKALMDYLGQRLFENAAANLSAHVSDLVISTNTDADIYTGLGYRVVDDGEFKYHGPLAGIYAALQSCPCDFLAIAACDQLQLPTHVYADLIMAATPETGTYAFDGNSDIPTCAVLPAHLQQELRDSLDAGERRLLRFIRQHCQPITFANCDFANINAQTD